MRALARTSTRSGFTLIELVLSVGVLGMLMWVASRVTASARSAFGRSSLEQTAEADARRAVDRIVVELGSAGETWFDPDPGAVGGTSVLEFRQATGVAAGAVVWGNRMRFRLELEPGETDDGTDEDGDGLVDERRIVWTRDLGLPSEQQVVLCGGVAELLEGELANGVDDNGNGIVNEAGFNIRRAGDVLTVRLSVATRAREEEAVATIETSTRVRN